MTVTIEIRMEMLMLQGIYLYLFIYTAFEMIAFALACYYDTDFEIGLFRYNISYEM